MQQTVPINTPLPGTYIPGQPNSGVRPYGLAAGNLFEYESGGNMRQNILMGNFNTRFSRNVSLFGNYQFNHSNDLPGTPTNPYNFAEDWGRSSLERRHRFQLVGSVVAPLNIRMSPFVTLQSGSPYDVVLGRDIYGNTLKNARPTFATAACTNADVTPLGDFCINPFPGVTDNLVPRNYLTGAGLISFNVRRRPHLRLRRQARRRQRPDSRRFGRLTAAAGAAAVAWVAAVDAAAWAAAEPAAAVVAAACAWAAAVDAVAVAAEPIPPSIATTSPSR